MKCPVRQEGESLKIAVARDPGEIGEGSRMESKRFAQYQNSERRAMTSAVRRCFTIKHVVDSD